MSSLETLRLAQKRLNILPERTKGPEPIKYSSEAREVAEAYYRCAVEIAKIIYTFIDRKYKDRDLEEWDENCQNHKYAMEDAHRILNESRNDVIKAVLPLFMVKKTYGKSHPTEDDLAAHDFIIKNVFNHMVMTFKAYSDIFTSRSQVSELSDLIDKVADTQRSRLEGWLANYSFTAYVDDLQNRLVKNRK